MCTLRHSFLFRECPEHMSEYLRPKIQCIQLPSYDVSWPLTPIWLAKNALGPLKPREEIAFRDRKWTNAVRHDDTFPATKEEVFLLTIWARCCTKRVLLQNGSSDLKSQSFFCFSRLDDKMLQWPGLVLNLPNPFMANFLVSFRCILLTIVSKIPAILWHLHRFAIWRMTRTELPQQFTMRIICKEELKVEQICCCLSLVFLPRLQNLMVIEWVLLAISSGQEREKEGGRERCE